MVPVAHRLRVIRARHEAHMEDPMSENARFKAAFPDQKDVLALPVTDLDVAARWYSTHFGMTEVEGRAGPTPAVILERDAGASRAVWAPCC
jgi:hypothetical protein